VTEMFNWNELAREVVRTGVERCGFRGEGAILVMNWISPNLDIRPHSHTFEQIVVCIEGEFRYHVSDEVFHMVPGSMLRVPANTVHYVESLGDKVALNLDIFAPVRDDYKHLVDYQALQFVSSDTIRGT